MQHLPLVLKRLIDTYLDMHDHLNLIRTCKSLNRLFEKKYKKWFIEFKRTGHAQPNLRFLRYLIKYHDYNDTCDIFACDDLNCIKLFITEAKFNLPKGLNYAIHKGDIEIVCMLVKNRPDIYNMGLYIACCNGQIDIVRLLKNYGANDWNIGLWEACKSKHTNIIHLMIESGASFCLCGNSIEDHRF